MKPVIARPRLAGGDGQDRDGQAWDLVRRVRCAAEEFHPIVNEATAGLMDLYEEDELILDDAPLSRALTVMAGVLTAMQTAIKMLDWLEPVAVLADGEILALSSGRYSGDGQAE